MSIIKINRRDNPFVMIDKGVAQNPGLSIKAKGLLLTLLSYPPEWKPCVAHLIKVCANGNDAIYAALNELTKMGYAKLDIKRDDTGRILSQEWLVSEEPTYGLSTSGKARSGESLCGESGTNNKDSNKKEDNKIEEREAPASPTPLSRDSIRGTSVKEPQNTEPPRSNIKGVARGLMAIDNVVPEKCTCWGKYTGYAGRLLKVAPDVDYDELTTKFARLKKLHPEWEAGMFTAGSLTSHWGELEQEPKSACLLELDRWAQEQNASARRA